MSGGTYNAHTKGRMAHIAVWANVALSSNDINDIYTAAP